MAGLLSGGISPFNPAQSQRPQGLGGVDPSMIAQLMQVYKGQMANPFARPIAGSEYLQNLQGPSMQPGFGVGQDAAQSQNLPFPQDFAGTPPGLPNLPDNFEGFGFGQTAPETFEPNQNMRRKFIMQLLSQVPTGF